MLKIFIIYNFYFFWILNLLILLSPSMITSFSIIRKLQPIPLRLKCSMHISCDVIIVGGGHAGCEAAAASGKIDFPSLIY